MLNDAVRFCAFAHYGAFSYQRSSETDYYTEQLNRVWIGDRALVRDISVKEVKCS